MPNIPQQQTIVQYVTNSAQTAYTFAFYAPLPTDIQVYYQASTATPIPATDILVLGVNYTVTYNADPITGGTITLLFSPVSGYYLTINRQVAASLNTSFSNAQNINGANLDAAFDRLLLLAQQNQNYALQRNLSYVINTYLPNATPFTQIPPLPQNYIWIGSASGVAAVLLEQNPDVSTLRSQLANNAPGTNGAGIVGYYDIIAANPTTVSAYLNALGTFNNNLPAYLAANVSTFKPGMMIDYAGTVAPTGWLLCDGSAVSRTTYAALFTAIGTTWGVGDGATTFNVPDFRRRVAVGSGGAGTAVLGNAVGNVGGEEAHTQTTAEMPTHTHAGTIGGHEGTTLPAPWQSALATSTAQTGTIALTINNAGTGNPFNVMQPSAVVMKIIKI